MPSQWNWLRPKLLKRTILVGIRCPVIVLGQRWLVTALLVLMPGSMLLGLVKPIKEPELISLFPLGGWLGTESLMTLRGKSLEGAYGLWFDSKEFSATVLNLQSEESGDTAPQNKPKQDDVSEPVQLLNVRLQIDGKAVPGLYGLRVITPQGISNSLKFWVHAEPSYQERRLSHDLATQAEYLTEYPLVVYGTISQPGEVDYYSFKTVKGEVLLFEVHSLSLSDMALNLYESVETWFGPDRTKRLAFNDEPVSYPGLSNEPILAHRFEKDGQYLVRVNGFLGEGGLTHPYFLRITKVLDEIEFSEDSTMDRVPGADVWQERTWTRKLQSDRMKTLWSRAVSALATDSNRNYDLEKKDGVDSRSPIKEIPTVNLDVDWKGEGEPPTTSLPVLLVGTIDSPGDIDHFRFSAKVGERIALEVETTKKTVPMFNPYLKIIDAEGVEVLTNVHSILNANSEIQKQIQPKTIYSFPRAGEFILEIRDITAAFGGASMAYRVLIRPQVPHMGQIHIIEDRINLVADRATTLSIVTDQEENFNGSIALRLSGLPVGVTAVTATKADPDLPPAVNEGRKERYVAKSRKASLVLITAADAPRTRVPVVVKVMAQPVMEGRLGRMTLVKELLMMVVSLTENSSQKSSTPIENLE